MAFLRFGAAAPTRQTVRSNEREVENNAGGFVYVVDPWDRLDRFLTIGTASGTYYVEQQQLTAENASIVIALIAQDAARVVARIVAISAAGRAAKQDYGIFALALCAAADTPAARSAAYEALPKVCRTASTLFQFLSYLKGRRGWSRGLRSAVARWYSERPVDQLAYQLVKYQNRNGFTHRDVLRLAHVNSDGDAALNALLAWAAGKAAVGELPAIVRAFEEAKSPVATRDLARSLPREALPTEWLNEPAVWEALLFGGGPGRGMPLTAMLRNLATMSRVGLLTGSSIATEHVIAELTDAERIHASRLHPIAIYLAAKTYASGHGVRGSATWAPVGAIVDALDRSFELAFGNIVSTNKALLIAVDSSGSMESSVLGLPGVSAREIAMATAFVMLRKEPGARLIGFTDGSNTAEFKVARDERLRDLIHRFEKTVEGRGTDCAIPLTWASSHRFKVDGIIMFTDSETWAGDTKVMDALQQVRKVTGRPVRIVTAATTATGCDVVDPADPLALGIAGFDAAAPQLIAGFLA